MNPRRALLALAVALGVVLTAAPALAAPPIGGGGHTGGGGAVGPGTGHTVPPAPPGPPTPATITYYTAAQAAAMCPATDAAGNPLTGAYTTQNAGTGGVGFSVTCTYAAPPVVKTVTCGVDISAVYRGPEDASPLFTSTRKVFPAVSTGFSLAAPTPAACAASASHSWLVDTEGYGHFYLDVVSRQVNCQQATQAGRTWIVSCGSPYVSSRSSTTLTVWCGGYEMGISWDHRFDADPCGGPTGRWTCVTGTPTLDGRPLQPGAQEFAEGKRHPLTFPPVRTPGLSNMVASPMTLSATGEPAYPAWEATRTHDRSFDVQWFDKSGHGWWEGSGKTIVTGDLRSVVPVTVVTDIDGSTSVTTVTVTVRAAGRCLEPAVVDAVRAASVNE